MRCNECGYEFNHWNEPREKVVALLGKQYYDSRDRR